MRSRSLVKRIVVYAKGQMGRETINPIKPFDRRVERPNSNSPIGLAETPQHPTTNESESAVSH